MLRNVIALAVALSFVAGSQAGPFGIFSRKTTNNNRPVANAVAGGFGSAQAVANHMASVLRIGHFGGNPYKYEGVGMGSTPDQAIRNCCYYGKFSISDQGVCQGRNGMWYACNRY